MKRRLFVLLERLAEKYPWQSRKVNGKQSIKSRWNRPPLWFCLSHFVVSILVFALPIGLLLQLFRPEGKRVDVTWLFGSPLDAAFLLFCLYACGYVFAMMGWNLLRTRRKIQRLVPAPVIRHKLHVSEEVLKKMVAERGIRSEYQINGQDLYDMKDFADATSLLRASSPPQAAPETLLRPAAGNGETPPEQLLRAVPDALDAETSPAERGR